MRSSKWTLILFIIGLLTVIVNGSGWCDIVNTSDLRLIPFPKNVEITPGSFKVLPGMTITVSDVPAARQAALDLKRELAQDAHINCDIRFLSHQDDDPQWYLSLARDKVDLDRLSKTLGSLPPQDEGYRLVVSPALVAVGARQDAGLLPGIQTLRQLVRANMHGSLLPCLTISDYPSLRYRGMIDDITRGPSPKLQTMERDVHTMSFLKSNIFSRH